MYLSFNGNLSADSSLVSFTSPDLWPPISEVQWSNHSMKYVLTVSPRVHDLISPCTNSIAILKWLQIEGTDIIERQLTDDSKHWSQFTAIWSDFTPSVSVCYICFGPTMGPSVSSTKVLSLYLFRASVETNIQRDLFLCIILASSVKTYVLTHISVSQVSHIHIFYWAGPYCSLGITAGHLKWMEFSRY